MKNKKFKPGQLLIVVGGLCIPSIVRVEMGVAQ